MNSIVKTFRGPDPRAALNAVRSALGEEAIILKTREVGSWWGRREVEITAAGAAGSEPAARRPADLETEVASLRRVVDELRAEVRAQRAEPRTAEPKITTVSEPIAAVIRRLVERGAEPKLAEELAREAARAASGHGERDILRSLRDGLRRRLSPSLPPWEGEGRRVVALVGPPGVGKTTTIAKIAARGLLDQQAPVALITVDTYRIGASDHLARYGEIMGVPAHVASDAASLRQAVDSSREARLVLIDTAGRSDPAALQAQAHLLRAVPEAEQHLVLSAATGGRELRATVKRFKSRGLGRVIFTKLDEADGPGAILSAAAELACPVSCVTDGQRVPDDVHAATSALLCDLVLGKGT